MSGSRIEKRLEKGRGGQTGVRGGGGEWGGTVHHPVWKKPEKKKPQKKSAVIRRSIKRSRGEKREGE